MALIQGKPMIGHVYERVVDSPLLSMTAVATCDQIIYDYITSIGGKAVMTADNYERASDRCAEALLKVESEFGIRYDIVVMVQGDEPMTNSVMISEAIQPMLVDPGVHVVNLMGAIRNNSEFEDRNCIKVVCDLNSDAMYFSREPIPTRSKVVSPPVRKQVCVIPFRRDYLIEYTQLSPTPLELVESIDMMRVLEHGRKVRMVPTQFTSFSVDTPSDLAKVEDFLRLDNS